MKFLRTAGALLLALTGPLAAQWAQAAPAAAASTVSALDLMPKAGKQQRLTTSITGSMDMQPLLPADASDEVRTEAQAKLAAAKFPMKMTSEMVQTIRVGQPGADGSLPVKMHVERHQMTMENAAGERAPIPPLPTTNLSFSARFNPKTFGFEVVKVDDRDDAGAMAMAGAIIKNSFSALKGLQGQRFRLGETVRVPVDVPMQLPVQIPGGGDLHATASYTLTRVEAGIAYFDVSIEMKVNANFTPPPNPAASAPAGPVTVAITGGGPGQMVLRLSDHLALRSEMAMKLQMLITEPDGKGARMVMDMNIASKGESLKPATR